MHEDLLSQEEIHILLDPTISNEEAWRRVMGTTGKEEQEKQEKPQTEKE